MLESVQALSSSTLDHIDQTFESFTPINQLAKRINLRPSYLLLAFFITTVLTLAAGVFSHLCVTIFGMVYPSYMTFKVLLFRCRPCKPRTVKRRNSG